jgi:hypothetical protein
MRLPALHGKTLTLQQYMDGLGAMQTHAGKPLSQVPATQGPSASTTATFASEKTAYDAELQKLRNPTITPMPMILVNPIVQGGLYRPMQWVPAAGPDVASWSGDFGDHSVAGAYATYSFTDSGTMGGVQCGGSVDAGIYILGNKEDLASASINVATSGTSSTANVAINFPGLSPINQAIDAAHPLSYTKTWDSHKYAASYSFLDGVVGINLSAWATATLSVNASANGTVSGAMRNCTASFNPQLTAEAHATASISIGIPEIADIVDGGVRANVTLAQIGVPTNATLALNTATPPSMTDSLTSTLNADFVKGDIVLYVSFQEVPSWLRSLFDLPAEWDHTLTSWNGFQYNDQLINVSGRTIPFKQVPMVLTNRM